MTAEIVETQTRVFELTVTPNAPRSGQMTIGVRRLSGPKLSSQQWGRMKEALVRTLINHRCRVYRVSARRDE